MNNVVLIGRLVADPDSKTLASGNAVANMRIAVDRGKNEESDFIDLSAFGKTAEFASTYLSKGRLIAVQGKLRVRQYEHNGEKRKAAEVIVDNIQPLDSKKDGSGAPNANYAPQQRQPVKTEDISDPFGDD
jgi:single-strand DNA-binding protein